MNCPFGAIAIAQRTCNISPHNQSIHVQAAQFFASVLVSDGSREVRSPELKICLRASDRACSKPFCINTLMQHFLASRYEVPSNKSTSIFRNNQGAPKLVLTRRKTCCFAVSILELSNSRFGNFR
jgi:hypothetical protein